MMIITWQRPKNKQEYKIYLNNTLMRQEETIKYLGIIIDKRFSFNTHIDYTTGKCIKLIHALSKSAKVNWGLRQDVLRMVYSGAILAFVIRSPSVDRDPAAEKQRQKSQENSETGQHQNRKSIQNHLA